ncbi:thioredoxin domain-containing protein [Bacteriovorax sp. Seq25_V]|uniref:thioredoxin domain-containing protein n=1 Tax=Bacteriovorax sp. Seq25_V TaxID=1201288 RepID=UPI00038A027C|nr:DUF255 domain-containing protein [Bacteriovorax sp. Seq25_V]EQC48043.1 PF03190 family protein [Bacteriovorax sp. Seq25_V]
MTNTNFNRLKSEKSTYLLQHKENPVHWWSWGPEALLQSKEENKPIFLSIGYSSCHWCHVMGEESFKNEETAAFLNENFICIKVDREEHPDIDAYYQQACHLFTGSGGWPLSAFLLPDLRPYFVGTYFPQVAKKDQTSFGDLLKELSRAFHNDKDVVNENAQRATDTIKEGFLPKDKVKFQGHFPPASGILDVLKQYQDNDNGGYGQAPKFPQFAFYEWALEQMLEGIVPKEQGEHIIKSLERILMGGITDQVRGGIHRYSTDATWTVPHFEKMLYDQAAFLKVLSKLSLLYPSPLVFDAIYNTLEYIHVEMLHEQDYCFSAQDADSEGVEGLYFTFTRDEFIDSLNRADEEDEALSKNMDNLIKWFNITEQGNFDSGLNVVSLSPDCAQEYFTSEGWELVRKAKKALLMERKMRIPPMTDNKGIASWNFQMITALSDVMQYCQVAPIRSAASQIFNRLIEGVYKTFIKGEDGAKRLCHTTTKDSSLPYLEDYVFFAEAQLRIYELSGNVIFKQNFLDTLNYIKDQFIDGKEILTRAKNANELELYPNQKYSSFDQSFKSPVSTLISLTRRAAVLFRDNDLVQDMNEIIEEVTHEVLKNPIAAGEALRALTYPNDAYKVISCPKAWLDQEKFANFIGYFLPRFVFDFHEDGERWEICSATQCELNGEGIDNFIETLKPQGQAE